MAQHATTRRATTNLRNARQARSSRESPFSVSAECGGRELPQGTGAAARASFVGGARQKSVRVRTEKVNFLVGRALPSVLLVCRHSSVGVCCTAVRGARGCPGRVQGCCVSGRPSASFVAYRAAPGRRARFWQGGS